MATKSHSTNAGMLDDFIILKNILAADLRARLDIYGYTDPRFAQGQAIYNTSDTALKTQKEAHGDKLKATRALYKRAKEVKTIFINHVKIARRALADKENHINDLGIIGKMPTKFADWTSTAITFYNNALATPEILAEMAIFAIDDLILQDGLAAIMELKDLKADQKDKKGIAQAATIDKNNALKALAKWIGDLIQICRIAFKDNLQLMERLNVLVYSPGYKKKKVSTENPEEPTEPTDPGTGADPVDPGGETPGTP